MSTLSKINNMEQYEIMTIAKIALGEAGYKDLSKKIQELIKSLGGKVLKTDHWGKRKLAYEIKHETEAFYDVMEFELDSKSIDELKSKLNLMDDIIRYLITAKS